MSVAMGVLEQADITKMDRIVIFLAAISQFICCFLRSLGYEKMFLQNSINK